MTNVKKKEVYKLKIPIPNISSGLARKKHMYICIETCDGNAYTVKCQSFKTSLVGNYKGFVVESDTFSNPFVHETFIECGKIFEYLNGVAYLDYWHWMHGIDDDLLQRIYENIDNSPRIISLNKDDILI